MVYTVWENWPYSANGAQLLSIWDAEDLAEREVQRMTELDASKEMPPGFQAVYSIEEWPVLGDLAAP